MAQQHKTSPQIRFAGFSGDWRQQKLGDIGKTQSGIGFPDNEQGNKNGIPFFKVSDMNNEGNENEMLTANNYVDEEQISRRKWKPIETVPAIMFAKVGAAIMLDRKRLVRAPFLLDNNTMAYIFDGSWDISFAKPLFETINLPRYAQVGALPSYNGPDVEAIDVKLPCPQEQQKIGQLFATLDNLITQHQREHEKTVSIKKAMLEKMFPKAGATTPEIRFAGFSGDWKCQTFEDLIDLCSGRDHKHLSDGDIPVYGTGGYMRSVNKALSPSKDAIGIGRKGTIDRPYILRAPFWTVDTLFYAIPKDESCLDFVYLLFQTIDWKQKDESTGVPSLSTTTINTTSAFVPEIKEQQKIGQFFASLDRLLSLQQRRLAKLKSIKLALLENMFV